MNTSRLLALIKRVLELESQFSVQTQLQGLLNALTQLTSQPNQPNIQTQASSALSSLDKALVAVESALTPVQHSMLAELGAGVFFKKSLADQFAQQLRDNAITPAVVQASAQETFNKRANFIDVIQQTQNHLNALGFEPVELTTDQAELGVLFPRAIFGNQFGDLVTELRELSIHLRTFSEAATGASADITVGEISTSDPTFFLGLPITAVLMIAGAVKWILDAWKTSLEIRKIYEQGRRIDLSEQELKPIHDAILARLKTAIEQKAKETASSIADEGRRNEIENGLRLALDWLAQRIERGLIIEIRQPESAIKDSANQQQSELFAISRQLEFPQLTDEPLLELTRQKKPGDGPER